MSKDGNIHTVIETLEEHEGQLACELLETRNCIATIKRLFGVEEGESKPKEPRRPRQPRPPVITAKKTTADSRKAKTKHIAGLRGPRKQFSQYKGVSQGRTKKDGTIIYRASGRAGKKTIFLGSFSSEPQAAAAVADFKGDKDEAARLLDLAKQQQADMAEQRENNPDRPPAKKRKGKTVLEYVCLRCGSKWDFKPKHCIGCQGVDFREVEKEVTDNG